MSSPGHLSSAPSPGRDPFAGGGARTAAWVIGAAALLSWPILFIVIGNHLASPDISRGVIYETVYRVLHGLDIYPAPSGAFVPLDYNPLIYLFQAAAALLLGLNPATLRLVAVAGTLGAAAIIHLAVRRATGSIWFGIVAAGLFAGAYRTFDCYLDLAQPDSWMLFTTLAGLYLLEDEDRPARIALAVALLCASFWFKQQGALLAIGGILYVTWRQGLRRAAPWWLLAGLLGPFVYFILGPHLFGGKFIYYTYEVPRAYSEFRLRGTLHAGYFVSRYWVLLAGVATWGVLSRRWRATPVDIWTFTFPFAMLIGLLGSMDYSEHNVYMAAGTWFIIVGLCTLARMARRAAAGPPMTRQVVLAAILAVIALSFAANIYDPRSVMVPRRAWQDYDALVAQVRGLGGSVYMPGVGQLPGDVRLPVPVQWVPLQDMVRGPGHNTAHDPLVREVLKDVLRPSGEAFIIADRPLQEEEMYAFLAPHYELVEDMGDRYQSLRSQPAWYSGKTWPRYLYRYRAPASEATHG